MTKKDLTLLEKIFAAEISGRLPFQSKSKEYLRLEREGMVMFGEETLPGRFPVTVEGWYLTHKGRIEYCRACANVEEEDTHD